MNFYEAVKKRRSIYGIGKDKIVSEERIEEIVKDSITHCPTAFNSQNGRVVLLFGTHHEKLWNIVEEKLRLIVPKDNFDATKGKLDSFKAGYGTALFYEDIKTVTQLQTKFELYAEQFPIWSMQAMGMLQYIIWTTFQTEGLGASLQHYNPLIDDEIRKEFNIEDGWRLSAQMPFGNPTQNASEKTFLPIEQRYKIFK